MKDRNLLPGKDDKREYASFLLGRVVGEATDFNAMGTLGEWAKGQAS